MGYKDDAAPWRFAGRALYQLNLVKSSEARKHVPADLKLVELFGYTLGGIYLARYEDSPVGTFDEMVALGGLVWNPPTSCAWAARVFVSNKDARNHGVKTCGLPSHFASFDEARAGSAAGEAEPTHGWWKNTRRPRGKFFGLFGGGSHKAKRSSKNRKDTRTGDEALTLRDEVGGEVCALALPPAAPKLAGPRIKMFLPSFSGRTAACPDLLKYSLELRANVRLSHPIRVGDEFVEAVEEADKRDEGWLKPQGVKRFPPQMAVATISASDLAAAPVPALRKSGARRKIMDEALAAIIGGKPLLCIAFDSMEMDVGIPIKV